MSGTAYIHIGPHKTGSTAIQSALGASRLALASQGYLYPVCVDQHSTLLATLFWDEPEAHKIVQTMWLDDPAEIAHYRTNILNEFVAEIESSLCPNVLISGEELSCFTESEVERLCDFFCSRYEKIKIIAYLRDPMDWAVSAAQEATKWHGWTLEKVFQSLKIPSYEQRLSPYFKCVGQQNVELRYFGTAADDFDVVSDFAQAIGFDASALARPPSDLKNASLSLESVIMLSAINAQTPAFVMNRYNPLRSFKLIDGVARKGTRFILPREPVEAALPALLKDMEWMRDALGWIDSTNWNVPTVSIADWYGSECDELSRQGLQLNELFRQAQNEAALKCLWKAAGHLSTDPISREAELSQSLLLTTDRWSLHHVATLMVETNHPRIKQAFVKQKLMRQLEAPERGDLPIQIGNPFDRF